MTSMKLPVSLILVFSVYGTGKSRALDILEKPLSGFINIGDGDLLESDESKEDSVSEGDFINTGHVHLQESDETEESTVLDGDPVDKPQHVPDSALLYLKRDTDVLTGEASTWGTGLYKTFNNRMFAFKSSCNFTFCRHCVELGREFNIEMNRNREGKIGQLSIVLDANTIIVKDGRVFVNQKYVQVPFDNKMIRIKKYGDYTKLESRRGILTLVWNNEDKLSVSPSICFLIDAELHSEAASQYCNNKHGNKPHKSPSLLVFSEIHTFSCLVSLTIKIDALLGLFVSF
ncbi:uncharacterized protein LOC144583283 [Pogona vitticeps]